MATITQQLASPYEPKMPAPDGFRARYAIGVATFYAWWWLLNATDPFVNWWLLLAPMVGFPALALLLWLLPAFLVNAFERRWRTAATILVSVVLVTAAFELPMQLGLTPDWVSSLARFEYRRHSYIAEAAALPNADSPHLKIWNWGVTGGAVGGHIVRLLVYDDSGQIALQPPAWSPEWRSSAEAASKGTEFWRIQYFDKFKPGELYEDHIDVRRLDGHFYLVEGFF